MDERNKNIVDEVKNENGLAAETNSQNFEFMTETIKEKPIK